LFGREGFVEKSGRSMGEGAKNRENLAFEKGVPYRWRDL